MWKVLFGQNGNNSLFASLPKSSLLSVITSFTVYYNFRWHDMHGTISYATFRTGVYRYIFHSLLHFLELFLFLRDSHLHTNIVRCTVHFPKAIVEMRRFCKMCVCVCFVSIAKQSITRTIIIWNNKIAFCFPISKIYFLYVHLSLSVCLCIQMRAFHMDFLAPLIHIWYGLHLPVHHQYIMKLTDCARIILALADKCGFHSMSVCAFVYGKIWCMPCMA